MSTKRSSWLIGCGIGCLVLVGILVALGTWGALSIKNSMKGLQAAVESREELDRQYGQPGSYTPPVDGAVPADRMEAFLAVREATQPARLEVVRFFSALPMSEEEAKELETKPFFEKLGSVLKIGGSALGLPRTFGDFFQSRNDALLEQGMGMGEYTYIYVLAYYGALKHPPGDGPGDHSVRIDTGDGETVRPPHGRSWGASRLDARIRNDMLEMLENQLAAVSSAGISEPWRGQLQAEIEAMKDDPLRVPWQDGLPPAIAASFEPYLEQLEVTYREITNEFELARNRQKGNWSIQSD